MKVVTADQLEIAVTIATKYKFPVPISCAWEQHTIQLIALKLTPILYKHISANQLAAFHSKHQSC